MVRTGRSRRAAHSHNHAAPTPTMPYAAGSAPMARMLLGASGVTMLGTRVTRSHSPMRPQADRRACTVHRASPRYNNSPLSGPRMGRPGMP